MTRPFNTHFYLWINSSAFSLCLESLMVKKTQLYGWHIFKLIFYYVTPPLPPSHLGMLDYVIRKIPRLALGTNTAPPALVLCRRPCLGTILPKSLQTPQHVYTKNFFEMFRTRSAIGFAKWRCKTRTPSYMIVKKTER